MRADTLTAKPRRSPNRHSVLQLGWWHFWLLVAMLAGLLGLVATVLVAHWSQVTSA